MRAVTLTNKQYEHHVYGPVALSSAKTDAEAEVAIRLMRKLNNPGMTAPRPLSEEEAASDGYVYPLRKLIAPYVEFQLEEDEYALLFDRVKAFRPNVALVALSDFTDTMTAIAQAKQE